MIKGKEYLEVKHPELGTFLVTPFHGLLDKLEAEFPDMVCYSLKELKVLEAIGNFETTKKVHMIKKTFQGSRVMEDGECR